ncbi:MAG TPA: hypothetical protein VFQ91_18070 [Bryobacteraceae bacterium]|nr:hypothetical protein [Bryobacteraceae bacterium]
MDHVRELQLRYGRGIRFVAVLQGSGGAERLRTAFAKLGLQMEAIVDEGGGVGKAAGVYTTPQAVLVDDHGRLYFRGNYNRSRYCAEPATEYVRLAIEKYLAGKPPQEPPPGAEEAYGCPLSKRKQGVSSRV